MPYSLVADFRAGVDRTRPIYASEPGTIWSGINGHLTRGGDFEVSKKFVNKYALPVAGTFGLKATATALYTFGSTADPGVPTGVTYQRLEHPTGVGMTRLLSAELYSGLIYAIAEYGDDAVHHFYNGTRITDWDGGAGNPAVKGRVAKTLSRKVYSAGEYQLSFSGVDTATGWTTTTDTGAGQINMSTHLAGAEDILALGIYQARLAVFGRHIIQLWTMAADPASNAPGQIIEGTGTRAPGSVIGFGDIDLFYLADSGVRSMRARDTTQAAAINDVGTPIDTLIQEWVATLTDADVEKAVAVVQPLDGRFWLAIAGKIFVFTWFPSKKIAAWSWYEPGFTVENFAVLGSRIYARSGDTIYLYGGDDDDTYFDGLVTLQLPFLSNNKPGNYKQVTGVDIAATGTWEVDFLVDPNDEDVVEHCGDLAGVTFPLAASGHVGHHTHIAPRLRRTGTGYASVSQVAVYFAGADSPGGTA